MYPYLQQLDCYNKLKEKVPDMLDDLEEEIKWYEETEEEIDEECLSSFLVYIYCNNNIDEWLNWIGR